ncbi:deoxyribonuclease I [Helcococcus kunzii]|uniref:endonuclease III domain-containing protein n=1 Tax=Helcococcus kunzii TaxID=40091 RepID=UPI001BAF7FE2|nr:deoxyribonuclease I [Helcococcus kunzii]QUY65657.1 deoxyribonuclease I [Helcococcus kunzii]
MKLKRLYNFLYDNMGPQGWWPAESKDEIILGAFLTQNTNWNNVTKSLYNLQESTNFIPEKIRKLDLENLETLIRPSGFFKNKARGIHNFFVWYEKYQYNPDIVNKIFTETETLRDTLLSFHGIGEETADVLLLYVFDRIVFISDTYARRLFSRLTGKIYTNYKSLHREINLIKENFTLQEAQEFHGLIDEFGKIYLSGKRDKWEESFLKSFKF